MYIYIYVIIYLFIYLFIYVSVKSISIIHGHRYHVSLHHGHCIAVSGVKTATAGTAHSCSAARSP